MKFKTKLYASIATIIILISISVVILLNMLQQSMVNLHVVVNELYARIEYASIIRYETANMGRIAKDIVVEPKINSKINNEWENTHLKIQQSIDALKDMDPLEKSDEFMERYSTLRDAYQDTMQHIITQKNLGNITEIPKEQLDDLILTRERMLQISDLLLGLQEQELKNELLRSQETYKWAVSTIYIYLAITLLAGIGLIIWIIRSLIKNLNKVTSVMNSIDNSNADTLPRIDIATKDEIGSIASAFNRMVSELEDYSKQEKLLKEEAEEHSWMKTKVAEIATLYPKAKDIKMLAELLISELVPMVGASYGAFYVKGEQDKENSLKRVAANALSDPDNKYATFQIGEGLIGQCALEKRKIHLNEVPEDYLKIRSGTGEASPKSIIILPVKYEGNVLAVIEMASFESFHSSHLKLLDEAIASIGIAVNSILNHMKAEKLLQESQSLTEELQVQSEELQLQQEELRTTNEKLEEQYITSEQKKKELEKVKEALEEKAQQLEISSQYKSEFLANMSHELRTPLNSLLILAQILSENEVGNLTEKQKEYVRTIYTSGNDLFLLINDVLDLAKVESGKIEVHNKIVDLYHMKDNLMKQFLPVANQKDLEFHVKFDQDVPRSIYGDEQRLQQILKNLLSNAFKFTEKGSATVHLRKVYKERVDQYTNVDSKAECMLAFSVIDTGIGIPKEKQGIIFEAFKQADGTTSRKYGGTGLGLSICRELAYILGGFIDLESKIGEGSNFTLYLPVLEQSDSIDGKAYLEEASASLELEYEEYAISDKTESVKEDRKLIDSGISSLKNKNVLIVDDDIRNIYSLTIALEKYEMNINVAENGREAIEMLQEHPETDIILMDIMMPEMDGFEAIRRIRRMPRFESLPIIALTAKAMKQSRQECLDAGATDYISKPINLDQLFSLMNVWLYKKEG